MRVDSPREELLLLGIAIVLFHISTVYAGHKGRPSQKTVSRFSSRS